MKNYLSMGFGVNSVALYLLMQDLGMEFEAVFVNHGGDWPETYEYADYFIATGRPVTVLTPNVDGHTNLYDYCLAKRSIPVRMKRWCTDKFKIRQLKKYCTSPSFQHIGIDFGESHRAKMASFKGCENRFLLIERKIDRQGCIDLIKEHGLQVPIKSGCYFCPFQKKSEWIRLRKANDGLWCKAVAIENESNNRREEQGKGPVYISGEHALGDIINDKQMVLDGFAEEFPPCQCGL